MAPLPLAKSVLELLLHPVRAALPMSFAPVLHSSEQVLAVSCDRRVLYATAGINQEGSSWAFCATDPNQTNVCPNPCRPRSSCTVVMQTQMRLASSLLFSVFFMENGGHSESRIVLINHLRLLIPSSWARHFHGRNASSWFFLPGNLTRNKKRFCPCLTSAVSRMRLFFQMVKDRKTECAQKKVEIKKTSDAGRSKISTFFCANSVFQSSTNATLAFKKSRASE
jgi:hypothetical protein